jgi:hypothetical protein
MERFRIGVDAAKTAAQLAAQNRKGNQWLKNTYNIWLKS